MFKKILFVIIAITAIQSTKQNLRAYAEEKEMAQNVSFRPIDETDKILFEEYVFEKTHKNFRMKNSGNGYRVVDAGFVNTNYEFVYYKFTLELVDSEISCYFDFSQFYHENWKDSKDFHAQIEKCDQSVDSQLQVKLII